MREFMILLTELLLVAVIQTIAEYVLDAGERKKLLKVVNLACLAVSYALLIRFVYNHLWGELMSFVNFSF